MKYITPSILFAFLTLGLCLLFLCQALLASRKSVYTLLQAEGGGAPKGTPAGARPRSFFGVCHPMEKKDRLPVLIITLVYALTAFFQLGDFTAHQGYYDFAGKGPVTVQVAGTPVYAAGIRYFSGLGTGAYNIEVSSDGKRWSTLWRRHDDPNDKNKVTGYYWADAEGYTPDYALTQTYNQLFKWIDIEMENPQNVQYLRITGKADKENLQLTRLCLLDQDGEVVPFNWGMADFSPIPEGLDRVFWMDNIPEKSTWHNSFYFDEIYHARTAKEHIDGIYPYEVTHPPLGKLILGLGIRAFGMTPFGWRCMGTLFGVLMLPLLYVFLKNMFGKTVVAACGTTLFAADFMHLVQTRIATIDTYTVFFILAMYYFLYRYLTLPAGTPFRKGALPLFLSGLMFGLGAACKWPVFYGGVGLAILYFVGFYQKLRDWPEMSEEGRGGWAATTLLFSVLCFILIPFAIYTAAYIPYATAKGVDLSLGNTLAGLKESLPLLFHNVWDKISGAAKAEGYQAAYIPQDSLGGIMANNQWYMLTYHQGVTQSHPYASRWYQWIVNARPILYYMDNEVAGYTTRFAAFTNPAICWAGLGAVLICAVRSFRRPSGGGDGRAALILVGYLAHLVPWMFIERITFVYHYFPSILFLVLALSYLFNDLVDGGGDWKTPVYGFTGLTVGLYALFYPVLIGLTIPTWYESLVKWLPSWPL